MFRNLKRESKIMQIETKIKLVPIDKVKPYVKNAKAHPEDQVKNLAEHIRTVGWDVPIVVDESMVLLKGHGRLRAAYQLGLDKVPVIVREGLSEPQKTALRIGDNKLAESDWIDEFLKLELKELDLAGWDLGELGFSEAELDALLAELEDREPPKGDPEETPKESPERGKLNDVWQLGRHRIMCGDSTDPTQVKFLLGDDVVDMLFTDPPYGMAYEGGRTKKFTMIKGDNEDPTKFYDVLKYCNEAYIWGRIENWDHLPAKPRDVIIWKKNVFGLGRGYRGQYEVCFYFGSFAGSDSDVWEVARDVNYVHPTQKPIDLCERAIANSDPKTVLDLYLGSGSTLIACEKNHRKCIGMEFDPKYFNVIIERWERYTGQTAIKIAEFAEKDE
jgi:hypothetical protein